MASWSRGDVPRPNDHPVWRRVRLALVWMGLLLTVWVAKGLPFDLLRLTPLIPLPVDWLGMATRTVALAAAILLARLALALPADAASTRPARWYGYAAFALALPYPVLRTWWALGGGAGLTRPGAAGHGFAPLLLAIPWVLAAALSLLLVPRCRVPRRLLLAAGWSATAIVGMIGLAACSPLINPPAGGRNPEIGIATWVFGPSTSVAALGLGRRCSHALYQLRSAAR